MTTARVFAPAKINLTLHVTGQRADGFHLLDSLVVFADVGDWVTVSPDDALRLRVTGPMARGIPVGEDNLVLRAARMAGVSGADIELEKHLPMASGIGGGSSDAAAVLRAVAGDSLPCADMMRLGADVAVCVQARTARMSGIGEIVEPISGIPKLAAVLVNPGVGVSTPEVFGALAAKDGKAMPAIPRFDTTAACVDWLGRQRNDLQPATMTLVPAIGDVLAALAQSGALLTRMSGSGATCFALYDNASVAKVAAEKIQARHPDWWVCPTVLGA